MERDPIPDAERRRTRTLGDERGTIGRRGVCGPERGLEVLAVDLDLDRELVELDEEARRVDSEDRAPSCRALCRGEREVALEEVVDRELVDVLREAALEALRRVRGRD